MITRPKLRLRATHLLRRTGPASQLRPSASVRRAAVALQQQGLAVTTSASGSRPSRRPDVSHAIPSMFALLAAVSAAVLALPIAALAAGTAMFSTLAGSTGEKPQSKIWYHDGSYWAVLRGPDGLAIYEKQGSSW